MKTKRWMTGWIAILLLCTFLLPAQAVEAGGKPQESTETVTYQNADYRGLSAIETAEKKLASLALSSEMIRQLSADKLELIQNATQITAKSTYYVESSLFPGQMDTVDENAYAQAVKERKLAQQETFETMREQVQAARAPLSDIVIPSPGNSGKLNGGTLHLVILLISAGREYGVAGIFQWETLPIFRATDAFGLSRDTTTSVIPQSASGCYSYTYNISYTNEKLQYVTESREDVYDVPYNELKQDGSGYGYAMEFGIPVSSISSQPHGTSTHYLSATGFVFFEGKVNNSSTTSVNHFATYAHKRIAYFFNGIDFSLPFGMGFSIDMGDWSYAQLREEHLWTL